LWRAAFSLQPVISAKRLTSTYWLGLPMTISACQAADENSRQLRHPPLGSRLQYTSYAFGKRCREAGVIPSMASLYFRVS
jgi:hypothetical protein